MNRILKIIRKIFRKNNVFFVGATDILPPPLSKEEEDYFDYLALGIKAIWNEEKLYFLLENGDLPAIIENQRLSKIRLRNMSNEYRENIAFLVNDIDKDIGDKKIKSIIKEL